MVLAAALGSGSRPAVEGDLFPIAVGDQWTYERTLEDNTGGRPRSTTERVTRTVLRETSIRVAGDDLAAFEIVSADGKNTSSEYAAVHADRVDLYRRQAGETLELRASYPRAKPMGARITLAGRVVDVADATAAVPYGYVSGVQLSAVSPSGGSRDVELLVPGVGIALERHVPGPLECLAAVTQGPLRLVRFEHMVPDGNDVIKSSPRRP